MVALLLTRTVLRTVQVRLNGGSTRRDLLWFLSLGTRGLLTRLAVKQFFNPQRLENSFVIELRPCSEPKHLRASFSKLGQHMSRRAGMCLGTPASTTRVPCTVCTAHRPGALSAIHVPGACSSHHSALTRLPSRSPIFRLAVSAASSPWPGAVSPRRSHSLQDPPQEQLQSIEPSFSS